MPVSIVVGGQYGSEGKGKVALEMVRSDPSTTIVVRPGGTNSGHTGYGKDGRRYVLRQLPAAAIDRQVKVIFPAGSYINVHLLFKEINEVGINTSQIVIDPRAQIITPEHIAWEDEAGLVRTIGSTSSGTGAAVISRVARFAPSFPKGILTADLIELQDFIADTTPILRTALGVGERILIEGTQGFGLSSLHGECWPKCTSRDTTAAAFLSEAGLSPFDVDQVVLVVRAHPIRVAGDSGPLIGETSWEAIARDAGSPVDLQEFTSVTHKLRRIGLFDPIVVRNAIAANMPTHIVLNHLDYIDWNCREGDITPRARSFIRKVESELGQRIYSVGTNEREIVRLDSQTSPIRSFA